MPSEPAPPFAGSGAPPGQGPIAEATRPTAPSWKAGLAVRFGDGFRVEQFRDNVRLIVPPEAVSNVLAHLKAEAGFNMLVDVTAVDYLEYPDATDRFGVVYVLLNIDNGERVFVKTFLNEPDLSLPSVVPIWKGAEWLEREVYDMFGIVFEGHPDLRRILMPDEFAAFPLRKDYPLRGRGERHNFPVITRAES
jgi:NADH-quinone oxidoreductase subunit C